MDHHPDPDGRPGRVHAAPSRSGDPDTPGYGPREFAEPGYVPPGAGGPGYGGPGIGAPISPGEYATLVESIHGSEDRSPPPGQLAVVMAALMLGLLLLGTQLWLLTVALELYLGGHGRQVWLAALVSGLIFVGGLAVLKVLGRRPRLAR
ncbi:MAG: hypothetical protein M3O34_09805 [Chloroflexota bacterium]|nr:hypothetical protein [Chloroflexota bacterium]